MSLDHSDYDQLVREHPTLARRWMSGDVLYYVGLLTLGCGAILALGLQDFLSRRWSLPSK